MFRRSFVLASAALVCGSVFSQSVSHQAGDIIFRRAHFDEITFLIDRFSPNNPPVWTHVGIVVPDQLGHPNFIVHAIIDEGVTFHTLGTFLDKNAGVRFACLRHPDPNTGVRIAQYAASLVGRVFDKNLIMSDEGKSIYCTELVELAVYEAGINVETQRIQVPLYREPIIHPDAQFAHLAQLGFSLVY